VRDQPIVSSAPQVNTRLQVEHGITEYVSRQDLVQWMLQLQVTYFQLYLESLTTMHVANALQQISTAAARRAKSTGRLLPSRCQD
jgi:biotin carboxylase